LRLTALESLAEALAEEGKVDKEKTLKALREREQRRTTARKIRFLQGKIRTGSTTLVSITDAKGQKRDITEKVAIERAILDSNKQKFSQSVHTPFYQNPLKEAFGFKGLTTAAQATLAGVYESNFDIEDKILDVIAQWQMPQAVRDRTIKNGNVTRFLYKVLEKSKGRDFMLPCRFVLLDDEGWGV
jgi:hypothetical protein